MSTFWDDEFWVDEYWGQEFTGQDEQPAAVAQCPPGYWNRSAWANEYWMGQYWPNPCYHLDADVDVDRVRSGVIRLRLNRKQGLPKSLPVDYWKLFAREKPEPVPDDIVVLLPGEEPPAPPATPKPRRRKKPAPVAVEPPKKDQAAIDRRDIADLFALLGIVEEPKPDDDQDMTDILGVIGILETQ